MKDLLFSAQGRIGRGQFWKGSVVSALVMMVVLTVLNFALAQFIPSDVTEAGEYKVEGARALPFILLNLAAMVPAVWAGLCLGIKRFHDRGKSGIWVLIALVPFIGGLWYFIETGFLRGTAGPNEYGSDPLANAALGTASYSAA